MHQHGCEVSPMRRKLVRYGLVEGCPQPVNKLYGTIAGAKTQLFCYDSLLFTWLLDPSFGCRRSLFELQQQKFADFARGNHRGTRFIECFLQTEYISPGKLNFLHKPFTLIRSGLHLLHYSLDHSDTGTCMFFSVPRGNTSSCTNIACACGIPP